MVTIYSNKKNYKLYEYECMKKHQETKNQTTWHWNNISEDVLFESGFIQNYYELRMKRKLSYELNGIYYNLLGEYGLDGISKEDKEENIIYHGIQCKLWKNKVPLVKLNTFVDVIENRLRIKNDESKGYLYSSSGIDKSTEEYFKDKNYYEVIKLNVEFKKNNNNLNNIVNHFENDENWSKNHILKEYQSEAINVLLKNSEWSGVKSLIMPCGTGKTVVFCNFIKNRKYKNIFIFSPLKVHARQNLERLKSYLPEYDSLLIDSESDGTRDIDEIKIKLNNTDKKCIFSSTFYSAKDIMSQLFIDYDSDEDSDDVELEDNDAKDNEKDSDNDNDNDNDNDSDSERDQSTYGTEDIYENNYDLSDSILIIDEAHNLINEPQLIKLLERVPRTLLVTATPPQELEEVVNSEVIYKYSMNDAIINKDICDYEIFLPLIEYKENNSKVLINVPDELNSLDEDFVKKGLFLINGMLKTGSRRCIVYLSSIEECDRYENILKEIMKKYHYLNIWIKQITTNTKDRERNSYLKEFEKDNDYQIKEDNKIYNDEIKILLSIRILDEGVDVPKCDSVFIGFLGRNTSDIRVVQRICRANRLDKDNINKKANCFLWTEDYHKIINSLQLLKENDLNFSSKIKMINSNYDENNRNLLVKNKEKELNKTFRECMDVKCLSYEELWEFKRQALFEYVENNNKIPRVKEKYNIFNIGAWLIFNSKKIKDNSDEKYIKLSENSIIKEYIDNYKIKRLEFELKPKYSYNDYKNKLFEIFNQFEDESFEQIKKDNKEIMQWFSRIKLKIKYENCDLYKDLSTNINIKKNLDQYFINRQKRKETKFISDIDGVNLILNYVNTNNKLPENIYIDGINIFNKFNRIKRFIDNIEHEFYKTLSSNELLKNYLDKNLERKKKNTIIITYNEYKIIIKDFIEKNNKLPSYSDKIYKDNITEKKLARYLENLKDAIKDNNDKRYKELSKMPLLRKSFDDYFNKKELNINKEKYTFDDFKNLLFEYCEKNNKCVIVSTQYGESELGQKLGKKFDYYKERIIDENSIEYIELSKNKIVKSVLDIMLENRRKKINIVEPTFEEKLKILFDLCNFFGKKIPNKYEVYMNQNKEIIKDIKGLDKNKIYNFKVSAFYQYNKLRIKSKDDEKYIIFSENKYLKKDLDEKLNN